jgi:putative sigma-54 modulation protein
LVIHITFRNLSATEAIKAAAEKRAARIVASVDYPVEVFVRLGREKAIFWAEFTCRAEHRELVAHVETKDLYKAIDGAGRRVMQQLRRERSKRSGHSSARKATVRAARRLATDVAADIPHRGKRLR